MVAGELTVLEALPCPAEGVERHLVRTPGGVIVEAVTLPAGRVEMLPQGGVFAPVTLSAGRVLLGAPLTRRLVELQPPPLAVLGLFSRILDDLELLHREGGAHGALAAEGFGVDETGTFRVRPAFHLGGELSPAGDVRALGRALATFCKLESLLAAGVPRAAQLYSGMATEGGRLGFADARAARQALAVVTRGASISQAATSFLADVGARFPPAAASFRTRPVSVAPPADRAARTADARAWLDRSMDEARVARFGRERAIEEESERLAASLVASTEATLTAARAVAAHEAAQLARRTVTQAPAAFWVGAGSRAAAPLPAPTPLGAPIEDDESVLDAASAEGGSMMGFADTESFVSVEAAEARAAAIEEARRLAEAAARVAAAEAAAEAAAAEAAARAADEAAAEAARMAREEAARVAAEATAREEAARIAAEAEAARVAQAAAREEAARTAARDAAAREEAAREEAARDEAARSAARDEAAPSPPAEFDDESYAAATPKWEGLGGVRGDESRMHEKGPGKWTLQGRSREELAANLPPGESRPMDLSEPVVARGNPIAWVLGGLVLAAFVALAWWATG